jgi:predicted ribosome quality control (RQC) complex YloA/Tae2 family protein
MNEAADAFYSVRLEAAMLESLRRALAAPVKSRIHSLQRRLGKIEADEARLNQFIERAQEGELLKANLSLVKKGMPRIVVQDWLTGQDRTIDLDPSLNPVENMQRMFKRSAKGQRGRKIVHERREETLREISALQDQLFFTESAQDLTELEALAGDASAVSAEPRRAVEQRADGEKAAASAMFRQHTAPSGRVVLVGKSSRGNEFLVRRKAAKEDLWFHVKDWPGAHVVLRTEGRAPAPPEDIAFAAGLAVRFSGARGKGKVGVIMALVKDLGRPKGGLPGQVTVKRFRTVFAEG